MHSRRFFVVGGIVFGLLMQGMVWATPTVAQADAAARKALELKQYAAVVKAYEVVDVKELNDVAHYRLAIAQQRLGKTDEARKALGQALKLNPKGTFASSPERLAQLTQAITLNIVQQTFPQQVLPEPSDPVMVNPSVLTDTPPSKALSTLDETVPTMVDAPPGATASPAPAASAVVMRPAALGASAQETAIFTTTYSGGLLALLVTVTLALVLKLQRVRAQNKRLENERRGELEVLSRYKRVNQIRSESDVADLVVLRDEVIKIMGLIKTAGTTDSLLFSALDNLQPLVEMEIGRNHFRMSRDPSVLVPADQGVLATVEHLQGAPMNLDGVDSEEVLRWFRNGGVRLEKSLQSNQLDRSAPVQRYAA